MELKSEDGSSLTETLIALAILLSVLVPGIMVFLWFLSGNSAAEKNQALRIASRQMEKNLLIRKDTSFTQEIAPNWMLETVVDTQNDTLLEIRVSVFKPDSDSEPIAELKTYRTWYPSK